MNTPTRRIACFRTALTCIAALLALTPVGARERLTYTEKPVRDDASRMKGGNTEIGTGDFDKAARSSLPLRVGGDPVWTLSSTSERLGHALAYDSKRGVTVLFGGWSDNRLVHPPATWEWDGQTWTLRATSGPSARVSHTMAYDSARGVTVLFGGGDANGFNGETGISEKTSSSVCPGDDDMSGPDDTDTLFFAVPVRDKAIWLQPRV